MSAALVAAQMAVEAANNQKNRCKFTLDFRQLVFAERVVGFVCLFTPRGRFLD